MAHSKASPAWAGYEKLQKNGDDAAEAIGTVADSYYALGLKVLGTRQQGWTACTGGTAGKNLGGLNGTSVTGTFDTTSVTTLSVACLALATLVYESRKTVAALQAALEAHGAIGTTIV